MASLESIVNGKIQLIPAGSLPSPGKCSCCGSVERDAIDFGITIDYYGAVLICTECYGAASSSIDPTKALAAPLLPTFDTQVLYESLADLNLIGRRLVSLIPDDSLGDDPLSEDDETDSGNVGKVSPGTEPDESESDKPSDPLFKPFGL